MTLTDREKAIVMAHELRDAIHVMGLLGSNMGHIGFEIGLVNLVKQLLPDIDVKEELPKLLTDVKTFSEEYTKYIDKLNTNPEIMDKNVREILEGKLKEWRNK